MAIQRIGHRYRDTDTDKTIDVWFPASHTAKTRGCLAEKVGLIAGDITTVVIESLDAPPISTEDAYLRLHLLSERTVKPNEINLGGIFGLLLNIAWTSAGPVLPSNVSELRSRVAPAVNRAMTFPPSSVFCHRKRVAVAVSIGTQRNALIVVLLLKGFTVPNSVHEYTPFLVIESAWRCVAMSISPHPIY